MKLPVFDGVQEALDKHNVRRKGKRERETTPVKKRRIELKKRRVIEGFQCSEWSKKHGRDAYGGSISDDGDESHCGKVKKSRRGKAKLM